MFRELMQACIILAHSLCSHLLCLSEFEDFILFVALLSEVCSEFSFRFSEVLVSITPTMSLSSKIASPA